MPMTEDYEQDGGARLENDFEQEDFQYSSREDEQFIEDWLTSLPEQPTAETPNLTRYLHDTDVPQHHRKPQSKSVTRRLGDGLAILPQRQSGLDPAIPEWTPDASLSMGSDGNTAQYSVNGFNPSSQTPTNFDQTPQTTYPPNNSMSTTWSTQDNMVQWRLNDQVEVTPSWYTQSQPQTGLDPFVTGPTPRTLSLMGPEWSTVVSAFNTATAGQTTNSTKGGKKKKKTEQNTTE
ncbi:hypothetical protein M231_06964 [Tremella mesenterica]|uniref:Uncharacterized protein n=1 Tax=Tremella mesenterica TaxID=5217 RepID=A0A4Q1BAG8_TREME|nr:hypothetical protein M231_06964 [Tremella mesenterica]